MLVTARRLIPATLALLVALSIVPGACSRRTEAPPAVDTAPARPPEPGPTPKDAALEQGIDARPGDARPGDGPPDAAGPPRPQVHRPVAPPRAAGGGGFKLAGSLGKADAETVLRGARAQLNACYQKAQRKNPALAGRVTFRLSIDNRGGVPLAEVVTSTLGGGDPERCMVEALRDLQFPPSATGGESTLSFPMTFGR